MAEEQRDIDQAIRAALHGEPMAIGPAVAMRRRIDERIAARQRRTHARIALVSTAAAVLLVLALPPWDSQEAGSFRVLGREQPGAPVGGPTPGPGIPTTTSSPATTTPDQPGPPVGTVGDEAARGDQPSHERPPTGPVDTVGASQPGVAPDAPSRPAAPFPVPMTPRAAGEPYPCYPIDLTLRMQGHLLFVGNGSGRPCTLSAQPSVTFWAPGNELLAALATVQAPEASRPGPVLQPGLSAVVVLDGWSEDPCDGPLEVPDLTVQITFPGTGSLRAAVPLPICYTFNQSMRIQDQ